MDNQEAEGPYEGSILQKIDNMKAENQRLRRALEDIATYTHLSDFGGTDAIFMRNIARKALEVRNDDD